MRFFRRVFGVIFASLAGIALASALQLCSGAYPISLKAVFSTLLGQAPDERTAAIVLSLRLPRLITGILVGANLSVAGAVFQALTQNEMASPYLLGVSHGAGLVAMIVLVALPSALPCLPVLAMLGGLAAFLVVYAIAWRQGTSPVRLVLAGVIVGAVVGSAQMILRFCIEDLETLTGALNWMAGSLTGVTWATVLRVLPWSVLALSALILSARQLDVIALGDDTARVLGMRLELFRFILAAAAILASAAAVSAAGMIGFIGLLAPHIVRAFVGPNHRALLLGCLFVGPALLVVSDALARLVFSPLQVPVGVITGLVGGIFFLHLMRHRLNGGRSL